MRGLLEKAYKTGSPGKTRTCDIWINSPPFYQLNYRGSEGMVNATNRQYFGQPEDIQAS